MIEKVEKIISFLFLVVSLMLGLLILTSIVSFFSSLIFLKAEIFNIQISHELLDSVLYTIILLELLHLTAGYVTTVKIDPRELVLVILTAVGRKLVVLDVFKEPASNTIAAGFLFLICLYALRILPKE